MRLASVGRYSLHSEGSSSSSSEIYSTHFIKMKYALVFLLVCVALASAAPQLLAGWPYTAGIATPYAATRTLVAGPTVVNGLDGRLTYPGFIGTTYI